MRLGLARRLSALVLVALLAAGCQHEDDGGAEGSTDGPARVPLPSSEGTTAEPPPPSPTVQRLPQEASCPEDFPQHVELVGTDLRASLNLNGVVACSDGAGGMWLSNGALVPWVIEEPVLTSPPPTTDLQTELFREAMSGETTGGLVIEPGQKWTFRGDPSTLLLRVHSGASTTWEVLDAVKTVADSKTNDGLAGFVTRGGPGRRAVVECARAGWDAGKAAVNGAQQAQQTPTVFVLEMIGLGQQVGACGTALRELERTQPPQQILVTADDLAGRLRHPQVAGIIDESATLLLKVCASVSRC